METIKPNELGTADSKARAEAAVKVLIEKKGIDVKMFDVRESSSITDFYVNATGRSSTQVKSLADDVVYYLELAGANALRVEGRQGNSWLLVDYGDVIVNVFDKESRGFYNLDRHLPEGRSVDITYLVKEVDEKLKITVKDKEV